MLDGFAHQEVPFASIVQATQPRREFGRHPLFDINFIYQRAFLTPQQMGDVSVTPIPSVSPGAIYDLNFILVERDEGWRISCEYKTDLFDRETIRAILGEYETILSAIAADPNQRLSKLLHIRTSAHGNDSATPVGEASDPSLSTISIDHVPPRNETEETLVAIWENVLRVHPISVMSDFFDLGGHSLLAVRLLARIEEEFDRRVPLAELLKAPTVAALALELQHEPSAPESLQVHAIQSAGAKTSFYVVTSQPQLYKLLASRIGHDQPVFGITSPEMQELPTPFTLKDVAENLIRALRTSQPHGPYRIGGWCVSGVIAFEMAQQLRAAGEKVESVVLLDSYSPDLSA